MVIIWSRRQLTISIKPNPLPPPNLPHWKLLRHRSVDPAASLFDDFLVSLNCFMEELPRLALGLLFLDFRDPAKVDTTGLTATALLWFSFLTLGLMLFFESSISFPPLFLMTETSCERVAITLPPLGTVVWQCRPTLCPGGWWLWWPCLCSWSCTVLP